jgi:hypothetical protein
MPYMQAYAIEQSDAHYYYKEGRLLTEYEPGSTCILAPGDTAWKSDLESLRRIIQRQKPACSLDGVVAKYLINERREA